MDCTPGKAPRLGKFLEPCSTNEEWWKEFRKVVEKNRGPVQIWQELNHEWWVCNGWSLQAEPDIVEGDSVFRKGLNRWTLQISSTWRFCDSCIVLFLMRWSIVCFYPESLWLSLLFYLRPDIPFSCLSSPVLQTSGGLWWHLQKSKLKGGKYCIFSAAK